MEGATSKSQDSSKTAWLDGTPCDCTGLLPFGRQLKARGGSKTDGTGEETGPDNFWTSLYYILQLIAAGGVDNSIDINIEPARATVFLFALFTGLFVFAVLVPERACSVYSS